MMRILIPFSYSTRTKHLEIMALEENAKVIYCNNIEIMISVQ